MKRMLAILLLLILLTGCTGQSPAPATTAPPTAPTTAATTAPADTSKTLHVLISAMIWANPSDFGPCAGHMTKLAQDAGFDLSFEIASVSVDKLMEDLDTRDDTVAVVQRDQLSKAQVEKLGTVGTEKMRRLGASAPLNRPAVLIRNDIWEVYSPEIGTGTDLEDFLWTLLDADPAQVPCAAAPFAAEQMYWYAPSEPLALFLPEKGYYPLIRAGGQGLLFGLWASMDGGTVKAAQDMDEARDAVERYLGLAENGLLDLYTAKRYGDLTAYPVILCNTEDLLSASHKTVNPAFHALDFTNYHIGILYSGILPRVPGEEIAKPEACAVTSQKTNAAEFDRFLTWLEERENYERFHGGGEDAPKNYADFPFLTFFRLDAFEAERLAERHDLPVNFADALEAVEYNGTCPLDEEKTAELIVKLENPDRISALYANYAAFQAKLLDVWLLKTANLEAVPDALFDPAPYQDTADAAALVQAALNG